MPTFFTRERIATFVVILALLVGLYLNNAQKTAQLDQKQAEISYYRDAAGNSHARIEQLVLSVSQMKAVTDSIAGVLKIKPSQINRYVTISAAIDTVVKPQYIPVIVHDTVRVGDTVRIDSLPGYKIDFKDSSFLSIQGTVPSKEGLRVSLKAGLSFTEYSKRGKVLGLPLGPKQTFIDVGTNNPYLTFSRAASYKVADKRVLRLSPGVGVGLNYNPFIYRLQPGLQAGLYLTYSR